MTIVFMLHRGYWQGPALFRKVMHLGMGEQPQSAEDTTSSHYGRLTDGCFSCWTVIFFLFDNDFLSITVSHFLNFSEFGLWSKTHFVLLLILVDFSWTTKTYSLHWMFLSCFLINSWRAVNNCISVMIGMKLHVFIYIHVLMRIFEVT